MLEAQGRYLEAPERLGDAGWRHSTSLLNAPGYLMVCLVYEGCTAISLGHEGNSAYSCLVGIDHLV